MSKKCDVCNKQKYEKILFYDSFSSYKEILADGEHLNPILKEKLKGFVKEKRPYIYVCPDCGIEMLGENRVKD